MYPWQSTGLSPFTAEDSTLFQCLNWYVLYLIWWPNPLSLTTTYGVSVDFLSTGYLDDSVLLVVLNIFGFPIGKVWISGNMLLPIPCRCMKRPFPLYLGIPPKPYKWLYLYNIGDKFSLVYVLGKSRTFNFQSRNLTLYPIELRALFNFKVTCTLKLVWFIVLLFALFNRVTQCHI